MLMLRTVPILSKEIGGPRSDSCIVLTEIIFFLI